MTPEQYNKLNHYRQNFEDIVKHGCTPSGSLLREIDNVYHEIYPTAAPTSFGCSACINEMINTAYNTLLNHTPPEKKTYKILLVAHQHTGGVEYYRMVKPNLVLKRFNPEFHFTRVNAIHPTEDLDGRQIIKKEGEPDVEFAFRINDDYLKSFDLIHFCRGISLMDLSQGVADRLNRLGVPFGLDLDDYWDIPEDHILRGNYEENNITKNIIDSIKCAHFVTCTTPYLAQEIKALNPNVYVLENGIDLQEPSWQPDYETTDKMRFGFMQGATHINEMKMVGDYIQRIFENRQIKGYQFVIGGFNGVAGKGSSYIAYEKYLTNSLKCLRYYPEYQKYLYNCTEKGNENWTNLPYRRLWATRVEDFGYQYNQIDVSVIPLLDTRFNNCKSELKLLEAGMKCKAAIVSKVKPYDLLATDKNSFQVDTTYSFYTQVRYCINNPNAVYDKAEQLRHDVIKKHSLQVLIDKRKDLYLHYIKK